MTADRPRPTIEPIRWVDATDVLAHEALDFTPWLADNLHLLAEALGFDTLELDETEYRVGDYRLDILATGDIAGEAFPVAIENQYGTTDHRHLGQLLTYLASQERGWAVWIVEDASDAHLAAVEHLNRTSDSEAEYGYALVRIRFTPGRAEGYQAFLEVLERPNTFIRDQRSRSNKPERRRFLTAVHDRIADPLIETGWEDVELIRDARVIRLHYPDGVRPAQSGFTHIRASKNFSYVHIYVNDFEHADENHAAIDVLRDRYGQQLLHRLPDDAEIEWHAGRPQDRLDAIKIRFDGLGYDSDPIAAAASLRETCQIWLELLQQDPVDDLEREVSERIA